MDFPDIKEITEFTTTSEEVAEAKEKEALKELKKE